MARPAIFKARPPAAVSRAIAVLAAGAALSSGLVLAGAPAHAQSVKSIKAEVAAAKKQLRQLNSQAEGATERYNAGRLKLASAQQTASAAQHNLSQAQARLSKLQVSVRKFAVAAYQSPSSSDLMSLAGGTTEQFLGRESSLQAMSASESQIIASAQGAQRVQEQAQADANAAVANQRSATAALQAEKQQIVASANKAQTILAGLQTKEQQIIKAAKARAAKLAAERAAAKLAAQQRAQAQAAAALAAQPVTQPAPKQSPAPVHHSPVSHTPVQHQGPAPSAGGAATAVYWAHQELGKPYVWGAAGPNSFDCSGLAQYVWGKAGVYLAHFTGDQWNEGTHVSRSDIEPGDLVFFAYNTSEPSTIHHVGIYIGGGQMIDAPYTGVDVRTEPAFRSDYIGAVRP